MCMNCIIAIGYVARATKISREPPQGYPSWRHWTDSDHPRCKVGVLGVGGVHSLLPLYIMLLIWFVQSSVHWCSQYQWSFSSHEWVRSGQERVSWEYPNFAELIYLIFRLVWWNYYWILELMWSIGTPVEKQGNKKMNSSQMFDAQAFFLQFNGSLFQGSFGVSKASNQSWRLMA